ncbi:hypothetical protein [Anaerosoma tenue]|uniref:hypothetical protein n=1 Tax=Anaerosoma tenue TaxID=2933588 RepID=UPI0022609890|nr:hypothetical protein [Anaerosoma tenue]MCK8114797.1 hypothetical protein [Anaerosoma tenue]
MQSIVRAIDAAFKSEVLEYRVRSALNSQELNEADVSRVPPHETLTGVHRWDFDWWLTEATLRSLHAGIDALAQLLNAVFELGVDRDSKKLPSDVVVKLAEDSSLQAVSTAVKNLWDSPECRDLCALVNHLKHSGFPERNAKDAPDPLSRTTTIDEFSHQVTTFGPWGPADIETMIDGFRRHAIEVLEVAAATRKSA